VVSKGISDLNGPGRGFKRQVTDWAGALGEKVEQLRLGQSPLLKPLLEENSGIKWRLRFPLCQASAAALAIKLSLVLAPTRNLTQAHAFRQGEATIPFSTVGHIHERRDHGYGRPRLWLS
jgi:hypothetical protein